MTTLALTTTEFLAVVPPAFAATSKDKLLPVLGAVRITKTSGKVTAVATDRYVAVIATHGEVTPDDDTSTTILLPGDMLKAAIAMAKRAQPKYGDGVDVIINHDGDKLTISTPQESITGFGLSENTFPVVERLLTTSLTTERLSEGSPVTNLGLDRLTTLLAVAKAAGKHTSLMPQSTGKNQPILFTVNKADATIHGMVMPERTDLPSPAEQMMAA